MRVPRLPALEPARWLGPWANATSVPAGVTRRELSLLGVGGSHQLQAYLYSAARPPLGSFVIAHGLNPWGPLDPRADRLARILAHAGFLVMAPALPDYLALRCDPRVTHDLAAAFDALLAEPTLPSVAPGVLSISFGSLPALALLADPVRGLQLGGAVVFGGYADPSATLRYCLGDRAADAPPPDPLNMPAVAINLVEALGLAGDAKQRLQAQWLAFARATWGQPQLKPREAHAPVARALADELPEAERDIFLRGAGVAPDSIAFWSSALTQLTPRLASIDPRLALAHAPKTSRALQHIELMHGRADDVIPLRELDTLARAFPASARVRRYVTGLYGHTQTTGVAAYANQVPALVREVGTFARMLSAVAQVATGE